MAVIGDLVKSRTYDDRVRLHRTAATLLQDSNAKSEPLAPLKFTVGDELQGQFTRLNHALDAVLRLRLSLLCSDLAIDSRFGIGVGESSVIDPDLQIVDGPAWWAARVAIDASKSEATRPGRQHRRVAVRGLGDDRSRWVNAFLLLQDQSIGQLSFRSRRVLMGMLNGLTQAELANREGVSASAISQRIRRDGLVIMSDAARFVAGSSTQSAQTPIADSLAGGSNQ